MLNDGCLSILPSFSMFCCLDCFRRGAVWRAQPHLTLPWFICFFLVCSFFGEGFGWGGALWATPHLTLPSLFGLECLLSLYLLTFVQVRWLLEICWASSPDLAFPHWFDVFASFLWLFFLFCLGGTSSPKGHLSYGKGSFSGYVVAPLLSLGIRFVLYMFFCLVHVVVLQKVFCLVFCLVHQSNVVVCCCCSPDVPAVAMVLLLFGRKNRPGRKGACYNLPFLNLSQAHLQTNGFTTMWGKMSPNTARK